jgi:succinate dehydrogenase / fumarate reductase cytochrome b subunit
MDKASFLEKNRAADLWPTNIKAGMWAFLLHRISGLVLVAYLFLHIWVITHSLGGKASFDDILAIVQTPLFLTLDLFLLAAVVFHGLNGLRIILFDVGIWVKHQKLLFAMVFVLTALAFFCAAYFVLPLVMG